MCVRMCLHVCVSVFIFSCLFVCVRESVCVHARVCVCVFVCMPLRVCMRGCAHYGVAYVYDKMPEPDSDVLFKTGQALSSKFFADGEQGDQ